MATIFQIAEKEIREDMKQVENVLLGNRAENLDHYRYLTGQLRGLTVALNRFKDLEVRLAKDDEDWED